MSFKKSVTFTANVADFEDGIVSARVQAENKILDDFVSWILAGNTGIQRLEKISIGDNEWSGQPMPADYPYDDNGFYEIQSFRDGVYTVKKLNESYGEVPDWPGFYSSVINQEKTLFTLVNGMASDGGYVGPYRACPYGAVSKIFELDFSMPGGLGKLNDNGDFDKLTITVQIEYRRAGSDDEYTIIEKSWTGSTNDELAETVSIELESADNYEFRVLRTSKEDGSTKALEEIKWTGLKSVIPCSLG